MTREIRVEIKVVRWSFGRVMSANNDFICSGSLNVKEQRAFYSNVVCVGSNPTPNTNRLYLVGFFLAFIMLITVSNRIQPTRIAANPFYKV